MTIRSDAKATEEDLIRRVFFHPESASSVKELAALDSEGFLPIPADTARRHFTRLSKEGKVAQRWVISESHLPLKCRAFIAIETENREFSESNGGATQYHFARYLKSKLMAVEGTKFRRLVLIEDGYVVVGEFGNVALLVRALSRETVMRFVTDVLAPHPAIRNTKTVLMMATDESAEE